jgi:hypothetical protein
LLSTNGWREMNTIFPTKQPHEVELEAFISHCRVMHFGIMGALRYAHAISALADQRDALQYQIDGALRVLDTIDEVGDDHYYGIADHARMVLRGIVTNSECSATDVNHRDDCVAKSIGGPCNADCCACNVGNPGVYVKDGRMICPHRAPE